MSAAIKISYPQVVLPAPTWQACLSCGGAGSFLRLDFWGRPFTVVCLACNGSGRSR